MMRIDESCMHIVCFKGLWPQQQTSLAWWYGITSSIMCTSAAWSSAHLHATTPRRGNLLHHSHVACAYPHTSCTHARVLHASHSMCSTWVEVRMPKKCDDTASPHAKCDEPPLITQACYMGTLPVAESPASGVHVARIPWTMEL